MKRFWIVGGLLTLLGGIASAQPSPTTAPTTAPVADPWTQAARALAAGLISGDLDAVRSRLDEQATIRRFGTDENDPVLKIFDRTMGALPVSVRTYVGVPQTLAADVANDVRAAPDLPEAAREYLLADERTLEQANATAAQWIAGTLNPAPEDRIAVILLCHVYVDGGVQRTRTVAVLVKSSGGGLVDTFIYGEPVYRQ